MNNFFMKMNSFFSKLFYGRNGPDALGMGSLIIGFIFMLLPFGAAVPIGAVIMLLSLIYAFFRMFSKNVIARRKENVWFLSVIFDIKHFFAARFGKNKEKYKNHNIFCCPRCLMQLRVPKGKGKINITCSRCRHKFVKKT